MACENLLEFGDWRLDAGAQRLLLLRDGGMEGSNVGCHMCGYGNRNGMGISDDIQPDFGKNPAHEADS